MNTDSVRLTLMTDEMYHSYFQEYENDPGLCLTGQAYVRYVYSREKADQYIRRQRDLKRITFAVLFSGEIAGEIIIKNIREHTSAEMGIALKNAGYKGRGIGTQAERLAVRYVFSELNIPVLYADAVKTNTVSRHVLEKAGFVLIGEDGQFAYYKIERGKIPENNCCFQEDKKKRIQSLPKPENASCLQQH